MYKDKDKQREAGRERARRYRNAHKSNAQEVTPKHSYIGAVSEVPGVTKLITAQNMNNIPGPKVIPEQRDEAIEFSARSAGKAERAERTAKGNIRVSKPGDSDYVPQCETTRAFMQFKKQPTGD